jgi:hypothetical protein
MHYLTVKQFAEKYDAFTEASLRYYIFHAETNGLSTALRRIGRKILIDENKFFEWIDSHEQ